MINTFCGYRFPRNYRVEATPDGFGLEVRRGNGSVLAEFEERIPPTHSAQPTWVLRTGWRFGEVLHALREDIEAERLGAMDREAHKRMRAATLNRRKAMARPPFAGRAFL